MLNWTQVISWDGDKITQTASHLPIAYLTFRNTPNWTLFKNYDQIVHIFWPHDLSFLLVKPRIMQILMIVYLLYWPLDKFWFQIHFQLSYDFEAIIFIRVAVYCEPKHICFILLLLLHLLMRNTKAVLSVVFQHCSLWPINQPITQQLYMILAMYAVELFRKKIVDIFQNIYMERERMSFSTLLKMIRNVKNWLCL